MSTDGGYVLESAGNEVEVVQYNIGIALVW